MDDKKKRYRRVYNEIIKHFNNKDSESTYSLKLLYDDVFGLLDTRYPNITDISFFASFLELIKYDMTLDRMLFILYCYKNYRMSFREVYPLIDKVNTEFLPFLLKVYDSRNCEEQFHTDLETYLLKLNKSFTRLVMTGEFECNEKLPTVSK